jgi:alanine racemase
MKFIKEQAATLHHPLTYASIDLSAIRHNFLTLQKLASQQMVAGRSGHLEVMPVIKADAYGHGMLEVARVIDECGGKFFGVSCVQEGVMLRQEVFKQKILIFETTLPELAAPIVEYDLMPSLCNLELASAIDALAREAGKKIHGHVKVDTAMGRLGVPIHQAVSYIAELRGMTHLNLEGIFTHFPSADTDEELTLRQIKSFIDLLNECQRLGIEFERVHAANSMGMIGYKNIFFNLARPGLMLYGLYPSDTAREKIILKPALSILSKIIFLKKIAKGHGISYGHSFIADRDITVAVLPLGYNDGYCRAFSNKAHVLIDGQPCYVLGRVTMDQVMVDVTHLPSPRLGMPVTVLGENQGRTISADDLALWASTISYEITCNLGNRLPRVYSAS